MGLLAVDTSSLDALAARMRAASAEALALRRSPPAGFASPVVARSLADFAGRWDDELHLTVDDASRLADAVTSLSRLYSDIEWANARAAS